MLKSPAYLMPVAVSTLTTLFKTPKPASNALPPLFEGIGEPDSANVLTVALVRSILRTSALLKSVTYMLLLLVSPYNPQGLLNKALVPTALVKPGVDVFPSEKAPPVPLPLDTYIVALIE